MKKAGTSHSASVKSEYVKDKQLSDQQLSVQDFTDAEESLVAYVQQNAFTDEVNALRAVQAVRRSSRLYKLDPILNDGILRVRGRLSKLAMPLLKTSSEPHPPCSWSMWKKNKIFDSQSQTGRKENNPRLHTL